MPNKKSLVYTRKGGKELREQVLLLKRSTGHLPYSQRLVDEFINHHQVHFDLCDALQKLRDCDPLTYHQLAAIIHADYQAFIDSFVGTFDNAGLHPHRDARTILPGPADLLYGGILVHDGSPLRRRLIEWLSKKGSAMRVVELLRDVEDLYPEEPIGEQM